MTNLVFFRAQVGKAAQLEEALGKLAQESRNEPGSLIYDVHRSVSDRDEYFLYRIWRSQTDLEAHMKAAAMLACLEKEPELANGALNLRLLRRWTSFGF